MRTKQLWNWTFLGGVTELSEIKNMPKELLNQLSKIILYPEIRLQMNKNQMMEQSN